MQIRRFRGSLTVMSFRLCSRAPWTTSSSAAIRGPFYRPNTCSYKGNLAGPRPIAHVRGEAGADRICEHVLARVPEVDFALDDPGGEAAAEQMASAPVPEVEALRVAPVQELD